MVQFKDRNNIENNLKVDSKDSLGKANTTNVTRNRILNINSNQGEAKFTC